MFFSLVSIGCNYYIFVHMKKRERIILFGNFLSQFKSNFIERKRYQILNSYMFSENQQLDREETLVATH